MPQRRQTPTPSASSKTRRPTASKHPHTGALLQKSWSHGRLHTSWTLAHELLTRCGIPVPPDIGEARREACVCPNASPTLMQQLQTHMPHTYASCPQPACLRCHCRGARDTAVSRAPDSSLERSGACVCLEGACAAFCRMRMLTHPRVMQDAPAHTRYAQLHPPSLPSPSSMQTIENQATRETRNNATTRACSWLWGPILRNNA